MRTLPLSRITRAEGSYGRYRLRPCCRRPRRPTRSTRRIAAFQAGLRARRPRRGADRAVGRPRLPQRHGPERAPGRARRRASRCCSCAATSSARAPRARCGAIEPFTSLRALPAALASARPAGERLRLGLELDVLPAASYLRYARAPARRRARPTACPRCGRRARARASGSSTRIRAACEQSAGRDGVRAAAARRRARSRCDVLSELGHHMRLHGHEGTIRFRGINSEFFFGQVLAGESGAVPGPTETPLHGPGLSTAQGRGPSRRPLRDGRRGRRSTSRAWPRATSRIRRARSSSAAPIPRCSRPTRPAARILRRVRGAAAARARPGARSTSARSRSRPRPGYAERFMGAGDGRVRFVGHCIGLELNEPPYLARGYGAAARGRQRRRDRAQARVHRARRRRASRTATSSAPTGPVQLTGATEEPVIA